MYNNNPQNLYYPPYGYMQAVPRYNAPQPVEQFGLKGRPVSSLEEAKAAQVDLDGSLFVFPDLGNKKIYTKKINADGTATLLSYTLEEQKTEPAPEYATKEELNTALSKIKEILNAIVGQKPAQKIDF